MATLESIKRDFELTDEQCEIIKRHFGIADMYEDVDSDVSDEIYDGIDAGKIEEWAEEIGEFEIFETETSIENEELIPVENIFRDFGIDSKDEQEKILQALSIASLDGGISEEDKILLQNYMKDYKRPEIKEVKKEAQPIPEKPVMPQTKYHVIPAVEKTEIPDENMIKIGEIPQSNEEVYVCPISPTEAKSSIVLGKRIDDGGREGAIYETNRSGYAAKIYNKDHCTRHRKEKIDMLIKLGAKPEEKFYYPGIIFPERILLNFDNEFVGYLMKYAPGTKLSYILSSPEELKKVIPNADKRSMVKLARKILDKIKFLHDHDILIGDLNLENILVKSQDEVYFVDTDSYQVGRYPSPVWTDSFLAPEIYAKFDSGEYAKDEKFMRTQGNELFSVAVLLFNLMMMGKNPYAHKGGGTPEENIKSGIFPYYKKDQVDEIKALKEYDKIPDGMGAIWSHIYSKVRGAFWDTFHRNGTHNRENTRYYVEEWIAFFGEYDNLLKKRLVNENNGDPMDNDLYPTRFRYVFRVHKNKETGKLEYEKVKHIKCKECKREVPFTSIQMGLCELCRVEFTCQKCGEKFFISKSGYEKIKAKNWEMPKYCPKCGQKKCAKCNKMFPKSEINHEGLCPNCRKAKCKLCGNDFAKKDLSAEGLCKTCRNLMKIECVKCHKTFYIEKQEYDECINAHKPVPNLCPECPEPSRFNFFSKEVKSKTGRFINAKTKS